MPKVDIQDIYAKDPLVITAGSSSGVFYTAHFPCEVIEYSSSWQIASASGTLQLEKLPDGVASGSGQNILSATISTAGPANTMVYGTLVVGSGTARQLMRGDRIANKLASGSQDMYGLLTTVLINPLGKGHYLAHGTASRL